MLSLIILLLKINYEIYKQQTTTSPKPAVTAEVFVVTTPTPETSRASWYDRSACSTRQYGKDCKTANGDVFDETKNTMACSSEFKLGSRVELCHMDKCIVVVCNDRGNFERYGRKFDLSPNAFSALSDLNVGVIEVTWKMVIDR